MLMSQRCLSLTGSRNIAAQLHCEVEQQDRKRMMEDWRRAHRAWRRRHALRIAGHAARVQAHLRRFSHRVIARPPSRATMGRPRAVRCVELGVQFRTLSEAAMFVHRGPSNIAYAAQRGTRCGNYHWELFDPSLGRERDMAG